MSDPLEKLKGFQPQREFFVGIDSDGCVFDSMEIKHKECFTPAAINHFGLQAASKFAREAWDFVNLYSKDRGVNRFPALLKVLEVLADRPEVQARGVRPPKLEGLRAWVSRETKLSNGVLKREVEKTRDPDLERVLRWSEDVNQAVERIVRDVPPFPHFRDCMERLAPRADIVVCSQTPTEALEREWREHQIDRFARLICGQELGTKAEHLALAAKGKYRPGHCLMVGDAPGDLKAARANGFLFFPICPGDEEASWKALRDEGLERFFAGSYAGAYEEALIQRFDSSLPASPPWKRR